MSRDVKSKGDATFGKVKAPGINSEGGRYISMRKGKGEQTVQGPTPISPMIIAESGGGIVNVKGRGNQSVHFRTYCGEASRLACKYS